MHQGIGKIAFKWSW